MRRLLKSEQGDPASNQKRNQKRNQIAHYCGSCCAFAIMCRPYFASGEYMLQTRQKGLEKCDQRQRNDRHGQWTPEELSPEIANHLPELRS